MMTGHSDRPGTSERDEAGQVAIIMGLAMFLFLALFVIVGDNAFARMESRNLQNAVDAAALAGAQELDGTEAGADDARSAALEWANKNIDDATIETPVVSDGNTKITVTARKNSGSLFGGALSLGEPEIERRAAARIASVNMAPCVVPLGVQMSEYQAGQDGSSVFLRIDSPSQGGGSGNGGPGGGGQGGGPGGGGEDEDDGSAGSTSNTGLLNLQPGNSAVPLSQGSCNTLQPTVTPKPGGTGGDVRNGLRDRLVAAVANDCYTEDEVVSNFESCKPELRETSGVQPTSLVLVPIIDVDIATGGGGASPNWPVAQLPSGLYLLAYFWIDGHGTFEDPGTFQNCIGPGQSNCVVSGKFLQDVPQDLTVPDDEVIDFDPSSVFKVVQLVE